MLRYRSGVRQVGSAGGVIPHRMRRVAPPADPDLPGPYGSVAPFTDRRQLWYFFV